MFERQGARHQLKTRVVHAWDDGGAVRVEHDGLRASQALDLAVRADAKNLVAPDGHGFLKLCVAPGVNLAVYDD